MVLVSLSRGYRAVSYHQPRGAACCVQLQRQFSAATEAPITAQAQQCVRAKTQKKGAKEQSQMETKTKTSMQPTAVEAATSAADSAQGSMSSGDQRAFALRKGLLERDPYKVLPIAESEVREYTRNGWYTQTPFLFLTSVASESQIPQRGGDGHLLTASHSKGVAARANQRGTYPRKTEIVLVGASNAGKSSLFNVLAKPPFHQAMGTQRTMPNQTGKARRSGSSAFTSKTPGHTKMLNFFEGATGELAIVDVPGYGHGSTKEQMDLLRAFIKLRTTRCAAAKRTQADFRMEQQMGEEPPTLGHKQSPRKHGRPGIASSRSNEVTDIGHQSASSVHWCYQNPKVIVCQLLSLSRGLKQNDVRMLNFLRSLNVPVQVIVTKCDVIVHKGRLAHAILEIEKDIARAVGHKSPDSVGQKPMMLHPVSSKKSRGIKYLCAQLWKMHLAAHEAVT